jgi:hypothetical protein
MPGAPLRLYWLKAVLLKWSGNLFLFFGDWLNSPAKWHQNLDFNGWVRECMELVSFGKESWVGANDPLFDRSTSDY